MRFLVDECTGPAVARWLREQQHDVFSVFDQARGIDDDHVLDLAVAEERILITNDKGFGDKIFRDQRLHCGVVLLRLENERTVQKLAALKKLLEAYEDDLPNRFVVVTEKTIRIAGS